jgi:hypothetical protein
MASLRETKGPGTALAHACTQVSTAALGDLVSEALDGMRGSTSRARWRLRCTTRQVRPNPFAPSQGHAPAVCVDDRLNWWIFHRRRIGVTRSARDKRLIPTRLAPFTATQVLAPGIGFICRNDEDRRHSTDVVASCRHHREESADAPPHFANMAEVRVVSQYRKPRDVSAPNRCWCQRASPVRNGAALTPGCMPSGPSTPHRETTYLDIGDDGQLHGVRMQRWATPVARRLDAIPLASPSDPPASSSAPPSQMPAFR